jgi:Glycosyl hydrolase family 12
VKLKRIWPALAVSAAIVVLTSCGQPTHSAALPSPRASATFASPSSPSPSSAGPSLSGSGGQCVRSAAKGSCGPYDYPGITGSGGSDTFVLNNMWAPNSGTAQTLTAGGPGSWSVVASAGPTGYTGVQTYPDTQQIYTRTDNTPDPLSGFGSIISSFSENMHATNGTSAEAAYDIWLGQNSSTNYADEVMIWNDQANRGTCGGATVKTASTFGGSNGVPAQNWTLCTYGSSELIWYLTNGNEPSGTVDVLSMLTWLQSHGYLPANSGLNQIDYGFEICSTPGPETFTVSQFAIKST